MTQIYKHDTAYSPPFAGSICKRKYTHELAVFEDKGGTKLGYWVETWSGTEEELKEHCKTNNIRLF